MKTLSILVCLFLFSFSGCGYKLGSMTVGGISTIAISSINNTSGKSFIEESLIANTLIKEFNRDGTVKVIDQSLADALIHIELFNYEQLAQAYSEKDVGTDFRLILKCRIKITETESEKVIFQSDIQGQAFYETSMDQSEIERITLKEAIEDLCIDIVRSVLEGGW